MLRRCLIRLCLGAPFEKWLEDQCSVAQQALTGSSAALTVNADAALQGWHDELKRCGHRSTWKSLNHLVCVLAAGGKASNAKILLSDGFLSSCGLGGNSTESTCYAIMARATLAAYLSDLPQVSIYLRSLIAIESRQGCLKLSSKVVGGLEFMTSHLLKKSVCCKQLQTDGIVRETLPLGALCHVTLLLLQWCSDRTLDILVRAWCRHLGALDGSAAILREIGHLFLSSASGGGTLYPIRRLESLLHQQWVKGHCGKGSVTYLLDLLVSLCDPETLLDFLRLYVADAPLIVAAITCTHCELLSRLESSQRNKLTTALLSSSHLPAGVLTNLLVAMDLSGSPLHLSSWRQLCAASWAVLSENNRDTPFIHRRLLRLFQLMSASSSSDLLWASCPCNAFLAVAQASTEVRCSVTLPSLAAVFPSVFCRANVELSDRALDVLSKFFVLCLSECVSCSQLVDWCECDALHRYSWPQRLIRASGAINAETVVSVVQRLLGARPTYATGDLLEAATNELRPLDAPKEIRLVWQLVEQIAAASTLRQRCNCDELIERLGANKLISDLSAGVTPQEVTLTTRRQVEESALRILVLHLVSGGLHRELLVQQFVPVAGRERNPVLQRCLRCLPLCMREALRLITCASVGLTVTFPEADVDASEVAARVLDASRSEPSLAIVADGVLALLRSASLTLTSKLPASRPLKQRGALHSSPPPSVPDQIQMHSSVARNADAQNGGGSFQWAEALAALQRRVDSGDDPSTREIGRLATEVGRRASWLGALRLLHTANHLTDSFAFGRILYALFSAKKHDLAVPTWCAWRAAVGCEEAVTDGLLETVVWGCARSRREHADFACRLLLTAARELLPQLPTASRLKRSESLLFLISQRWTLSAEDALEVSFWTENAGCVAAVLQRCPRLSSHVKQHYLLRKMQVPSDVQLVLAVSDPVGKSAASTT